MMLKNPELVKQLTALYTVRIIFLKKPDGSKRPIQIEESLLRLFHKVLLRKISHPIMEKITEA